MVNNRNFVPWSPLCIERPVRSRLYPVSSPHAIIERPRLVLVTTRQPSATQGERRQAFPEAFMSNSATQSYTHNIHVAVKDGGHTYNYMVFLRRHVGLPPNQCLDALIGGPSSIRSDVVIMRIGTKAAYINMRGRDCSRADWVIRRLIASNVVAKRSIPRTITYNRANLR